MHLLICSSMTRVLAWFGLGAGMIMGASASSVWYNLQVSHPTKEAPVIDYKLALLFQPMLMLGITIGVELSVIFPYWLITVLIIILFVGNERLSLHAADLSKPHVLFCSVLLLSVSDEMEVCCVRSICCRYFIKVVLQGNSHVEGGDQDSGWFLSKL